MAKKIRISDIHAIEFNQRARGRDTPYYVGTVWDISGSKATRVGDFHNEGAGGPTCVRINPPNRDALTELGDAAFSDLGIEAFESEGHVVMYAEFIGYELKCACDEFTLQDFTDLVRGDPSFGEPRLEPVEGTAEQKSRAAVAEVKANRIKIVRDAKRLAKQGKTIVRIGDAYYTYGTRDEAAIRRDAELKSKGAEVEILA